MDPRAAPSTSAHPCPTSLATAAAATTASPPANPPAMEDGAEGNCSSGATAERRPCPTTPPPQYESDSGKIFYPVEMDNCEAIERAKVKTVLCINYMHGRRCRFGPRCAFAHGEAELRPPTEEMLQKKAMKEQQKQANMEELKRMAEAEQARLAAAGLPPPPQYREHRHWGVGRGVRGRGGRARGGWSRNYPPPPPPPPPPVPPPYTEGVDPDVAGYGRQRDRHPRMNVHQANRRRTPAAAAGQHATAPPAYGQQ